MFWLCKLVIWVPYQIFWLSISLAYSCDHIIWSCNHIASYILTSLVARIMVVWTLGLIPYCTFRSPICVLCSDLSRGQYIRMWSYNIIYSDLSRGENLGDCLWYDMIIWIYKYAIINIIYHISSYILTSLVARILVVVFVFTPAPPWIPHSTRLSFEVIIERQKQKELCWKSITRKCQTVKSGSVSDKCVATTLALEEERPVTRSGVRQRSATYRDIDGLRIENTQRLFFLKMCTRLY